MSNPAPDLEATDLEATQPIVVISVDLVKDAERRPSGCDGLFPETGPETAARPPRHLREQS
jgi:hypothetical protein